MAPIAIYEHVYTPENTGASQHTMAPVDVHRLLHTVVLPTTTPIM